MGIFGGFARGDFGVLRNDFVGSNLRKVKKNSVAKAGREAKERGCIATETAIPGLQNEEKLGPWRYVDW